MRKTKTEKGITLIALIITIVVLLILAVVAINSIRNDGILGYAENTAKDYNESVSNEQNMLGKYDDFLKNHIGSADGELSGTLVSLYKAGKLKVGDYVNYKPSKKEDGSVKTYKPDGETKGSLTGYTEGELQNIGQEDLNWRVLGYDSTKDELLLISGAPTINTISFYGLTAYNNYEEVLNDTCEALYSNTSIEATARSMTYEDINTYFVSSSSSSEYSYKNSNTRVATTETVSTLGVPRGEYVAANEITEDATKLELLLGKKADEYSYYYWVASKFSGVFSGAGECYVFVGIGDGLGLGVFYFDGDPRVEPEVLGSELCIRPIVSLKSDVSTDDVAILKTEPNETWDDPLGYYEEEGETT